jgi:hypothetical protein
LGCNFSGTSSQGFPVTKHQGVFPAKKKCERQRTRSPTPKKKRERQRTPYFKRCQTSDKFLFFGIFFLFFPEIRRKIKEKIEKDNKGVNFLKSCSLCIGSQAFCASEAKCREL